VANEFSTEQSGGYNCSIIIDFDLEALIKMRSLGESSSSFLLALRVFSLLLLPLHLSTVVPAEAAHENAQKTPDNFLSRYAWFINLN
jgi:hypothetical protein